MGKKFIFLIVFLTPLNTWSFEFLQKRGLMSLQFYDVFLRSQVPVAGKYFFFNLVRPRVILEFTPIEWIKMVFAGDFEFYSGDKDGIALVNSFLREEENTFLKAEGFRAHTDHLLLYARLYRGYIRFRKSIFTVTAGRQRINWGKGFFFTPLNPFTPKINLSVEPDQVPGIDAFSISANVSNFWVVEGIYAPPGNEHKFGLRISGVLKGVDVSLIYARTEGVNMAGLSASYPLFDGVLSAEVRVPRKTFDFLMGYRRTFSHLLTLLFEYYYHGSDKPSLPHFTSDSFDTLEETGNIFTYPGRGELGTHYIAFMVDKEFSYPISLSTMFEVNLSDMSFVVLLRGLWSPFAWLEVEVGGLIPYGGVNDEFWFMKKSIFGLIRVFL